MGKHLWQHLSKLRSLKNIDFSGRPSSDASGAARAVARASPAQLAPLPSPPPLLSHPSHPSRSPSRSRRHWSCRLRNQIPPAPPFRSHPTPGSVWQMRHPEEQQPWPLLSRAAINLSKRRAHKQNKTQANRQEVRSRDDRTATIHVHSERRLHSIRQAGNVQRAPGLSHASWLAPHASWPCQPPQKLCSIAFESQISIAADRSLQGETRAVQ